MLSVNYSKCFTRSLVQHTQFASVRWRRPRSSPFAQPLASAARSDTAPVWETLVLVNSPAGGTQNPDEQQELLDTLWSLQYRTPGICCASAGPVIHSASWDGNATGRAAVYYRFSAQAQAERFVAGSAFADAKARVLGCGTVTLSLWKVLVPNDMEALFKRGPAFEGGVDLVLVLQPGADTGAAGHGESAGVPGSIAPPTEAVVAAMGRLQAAALAAGGVQVSCGTDIMSLDTRYIWMTRFPQEDAAQSFLRSTVVAELAGGAVQGEAQGVSPLALKSMAMVEVGAVQQSKQRL